LLDSLLQENKMEQIHKSKQRSWISEEMTPSEILHMYKTDLAALKPNSSVCEATARPFHFKQMIGIEDDETFKQLEAAMDIDNLTTEGEPHPMQIVTDGHYGIGVPKYHVTHVPEEARLSFKSLYLNSKYMTSGREVKKKRRRMLYEENSNWLKCQPPPYKHINIKLTDKANLYVVRIYRPLMHLSESTTVHKDIVYSQEIWILGHQKLSELRDLITCPADLYIVGERQYDTVTTRADRANDVYKSGFFYINGCFYNDTRCAENIDYSQVIIDWAASSKRDIGPFTKGVMEDTTLDQLTLQIGYPYVYTHQGNHEHLMVFKDARLVGPEDPQTESKYPFVRSIGSQLNRICMTCQVDTATWVTINHSRLPETPFYFCTGCYKQFNFKPDGTKDGEFEAYRYLDVNCV